MARKIVVRPNGQDAAGTEDATPPGATQPEATTAVATMARHAIAQMRRDPAAIRRLFESGDYPYHARLRMAAYEDHMLELQRELLKAQRWVEAAGERIILVFEGRDAAGKGGTIKRFTEHMNPRTARVVALQKPTERERTQWYFQRYIAHLPAEGE
jgi:polyphosphate kinase 2 (PPK2 family)